MIIVAPVYLGLIGTTGALLLMLRWFRTKTILCNCESAISKHAIITGANSGIGRAIAFELARRNWRVTLACRDLDAAEQAKNDIISSTDNSALSVESLDLTDRASIDRFVGSVRKSKVDVLINNAGIMAASPKPVKSFGGLNIDTTTNYLGTFYLTHSMLPLFKGTHDDETSYPRVIFVSSSLSAKGSVSNLLQVESPTTPWDTTKAYADSKLACCLLARELHRRYGTGANKMMNVYCLFTGGMINTRLSREIFQRYSSPTQWLLRGISQMLLKSPMEGCQTVLHCAISSNVSSAHTSTATPMLTESNGLGSGLLYKNCSPIDWPDASNDSPKAQSLWCETMKFLDLSDSC